LGAFHRDLDLQPVRMQPDRRHRLAPARAAIRAAVATILVLTTSAGSFLAVRAHVGSASAGRSGLVKAAFQPGDPQLTHPCPADTCSPDWSAKGGDGVAYRLVRVGVENRASPLVLAVPEGLLDRFPFPECDESGFTASTAAVARPRLGQPPRPGNCQNGVVSRVSLVATLPALEPAGQASLTTREDRDDIVTMVIDVQRAKADFRRALSADRSGGLETWLTAWSTAMARKGYLMARKAPAFGLNRLGPEHGLVGRDATTLSDVLFSGDAVGGSSDVLMCTVEEALLDDGQPKMGLKPAKATCWHWFAVPDLGLEVRLSYDRCHLPNWRETRAMALAKVTRFAQTADPRP
jgi:hypothetical protein